MKTRHRPLGTLLVALVAALGLWALPAHAGSRGHSGPSYACGSGSFGSHGRYYRRGNFGPAPYYVHYRSYRSPRGYIHRPPYRYQRSHVRHGRWGYTSRGRGYRGYRGYRGSRVCRW